MQVKSMNFCECKVDGFCPRYRREMGGRLRELCAGINVDLGTAAAFREQWQREVDVPPHSVARPRSILLKTDQAPGDALAMTAAIYSLHRAHTGRYITSVESYWPEVFFHNPDVTTTFGASEVQMHYPAIHQSNERGIHFMQGWCEFLGAALGVTVPLLTNRPHLYFDEPTPPMEDFWLVCSGGKRDFTNKLWGYHNYQKVVDILAGKVKFIQVGGMRTTPLWAETCVGSQKEDHPRLSGVEFTVGKTSLRELFNLTRRARGVLCGVSLLMHVAAALEKPAVVVAGGREPVQWNAYPKQHYLHTVGTLPCHDMKGNIGGACWRSRTVPLGDNTNLDKDTCEYPIDGTPKCMTLISPEYVAETIMQICRGSTYGVPKELAQEEAGKLYYRGL